MSSRSRIADVSLGIAQPRTKHEEIMLCIESTNDIVSEIISFLKYMYPRSYKNFRDGSKE